MKHLLAAAALSLLTIPALAAPASAPKLDAATIYTQAQFQVEDEGRDRDRDRDGWRRDDRGDQEDWRGRRERRGWREGRDERCRVTIIRRDDGSVRRIRRCY